MSEQHSTTGLYVIIFGLAALGALGFVTGFGPATLVFLLAALIVAVTQRSRLAKAIRTPDTDVRRRRLRTAGICAAAFVACYGIWIWDVNDGSADAVGILANVVGTAAMVATAVLLVAGLLTPRTPSTT